MLDESIHWDRMSKGVKWPKMTLTYSDGSVEYTDGSTYQYQHGLKRNGKRPVKIELGEKVTLEMLDTLCTNHLHAIDKTLLDVKGKNYCDNYYPVMTKQELMQNMYEDVLGSHWQKLYQIKELVDTVSHLRTKSIADRQSELVRIENQKEVLEQLADEVLVVPNWYMDRLKEIGL